MKLNYIETPIDLGGGAVPGCGTIHKSEIKETLTKLSDDLELPFDLNDYTLGSTGKRDYSGDIDLVIDTKWWNYGPVKFRQDLAEVFGLENTAKNGDMVHLKYPIVSYKEELQGAQPRTGFVQIDFNFGNTEWEKFYHYSPGDKSAYKGAHRNLAISAIASVVGTVESQERDFHERPVEIIRYTFGPTGFKRVVRRSLKDSRSGNWLKKQEDTLLEGPYFDPNVIAKLLFKDEHASKLDLISLETIMIAIDKYCGLVEKERIYRRIASNFASWNQGKLFHYPPEIEAYFQRNDK